VGITSLQKFTPGPSLRSGVFLKWMLPPTLIAFTCLFLLLPIRGHALDTTPPAPATTGSASWNSLTAQQKQALAPLAKDWAGYPADRKQKWLVFADKFQKMKPEDQQRAQEKMAAWTKLTPEQRLAARENYIRSNKLPPEQRAQKWQEYNQLPDDQKAQLASHPDKKKLVTNLPTPAESKEKKLQPLKAPKKPATTASQPAATPAPIAAPTGSVPAGSASPNATPAPSVPPTTSN